MAIRAVFFDLSGVLYNGDRVITGANDAITAARKRGLAVRFVTNTATKSREQILAKLKTLGLEVNSQELFTAPDAALGFVQQRGLTPFALVHESIAPLFHKAFYKTPHKTDEPDCVVLGDAREQLTYAPLNRAFALLMQGKPLIGIGDNRYFSDGDQLLLDAGPFIHALSYAADTRAVIMGKPSADFFAQVVSSVNLKAGECLMLGDDILGDVEGALKAGLQAALVRTGKYQQGDENRVAGNFAVLDSVAALESLL
ncbi:TIGR01458 family HAD-type hydrolase [Gilvimarinus chinensis]|uniref:TIGR01458 family HAD-type hydrolase n=1 Tax=Gilvimarinus chinensis TaxID=396005 RepID=UPI00037F8451|nr:TIGR01458 family HAD-type hydrolase [Gilvimarinus chinensis]